MGNMLVIPRKRLPCFLSVDESSIIGKYDKRAAPPTKKIGDREKSSRADGADSDLAIWALMQRDFEERRVELLLNGRHWFVETMVVDQYGNRSKLRSTSV